jgi:hypothetical protein
LLADFCCKSLFALAIKNTSSPEDFAALVNPANAMVFESTLKDVEPAARAMGLQIQVVRASTTSTITAVDRFIRSRSLDLT